jgi:hypothetical protein
LMFKMGLTTLRMYLCSLFGIAELYQFHSLMPVVRIP